MSKISNRSILICDRNIEYTLKKNKRQKNIILKVNEGKLIISTPSVVSIYVVEKFINQKRKWIIDSIDKTKINDKVTLDDKVWEHIKNANLELIKQKLEYFNKHYKFKYNKVRIRHQKTRWGSCSSDKDFNFNIKIICLPEELQDYIVVHELCHLKEMNHSKKFWDLVEQKIPNQKEIRKKLKKYNVQIQ